MRYWKRLNKNGTTNTVEAYSHALDVDGAVEIDEAEFTSYIVSLPPEPAQEPPRDLAKELDELKAELKGKGIL